MDLFPFNMYIAGDAVSCDKPDDLIPVCNDNPPLVLFDHQFKGLCGIAIRRDLPPFFMGDICL